MPSVSKTIPTLEYIYGLEHKCTTTNLIYVHTHQECEIIQMEGKKVSDVLLLQLFMSRLNYFKPKLYSKATMYKYVHSIQKCMKKINTPTSGMKDETLMLHMM